MSETTKELGKGWKEDISEDLNDIVRKLLDTFLAKYRLWYNWHKTIYTGKTVLSNEKLMEDELGIGINFKKLVEAENYI